MSNLVQGMAWQVECAPTVKLVLMALADWSNDEGTCWPGQQSIAKRACVSDRTVRDALAKLKAMGLLEWRSRNCGECRQTNVYQINIESLSRAANISGRPTPERKPASGAERKPASGRTISVEPQDKQINASAPEDAPDTQADKLTHGDIINAMRRLGGKVRIGDSYFRKASQEIIAMGATKDEFIEACRKAANSTGGDPWGIAYVRKVIASFVAAKEPEAEPKQWFESATGVQAKAEEMAAVGFELRPDEPVGMTKERLRVFMGTNSSGARNSGKSDIPMEYTA